MKKEFREYHSPSSGIFFASSMRIFYAESPYQKIEIIAHPYFGKVLLLDGLVQTTEKDEFFYHEMLAHPAMTVHPDPKDVLIIGGGDGGVLKEVLRYPVQSVYLVEIDAQVVEATRTHFPWLNRCLKDNRTRVVMEDGRAFLRKTDQRFDVILVDSSDPVGPSRVLHRKDFYERLKQGLAPGGIACVQLGSPVYQLKAILRREARFIEIFRLVYLYTAPVPTYPGGLWCYGFLTDTREPFDLKRKPPQGLKFYNSEIHRAAFARPNFLARK